MIANWYSELATPRRALVVMLAVVCLTTVPFYVVGLSLLVSGTPSPLLLAAPHTPEPASPTPESAPATGEPTTPPTVTTVVSTPAAVPAVVTVVQPRPPERPRPPPGRGRGNRDD